MKKGDRVGWRSGRRSAKGTVERVITGRAKVGGRTVVGSKADPRYVVRDETSGATTVRKGGSLRTVRSSGARARKAPAKRAPARKATTRKTSAAKKAPAKKASPARKASAAKKAPPKRALLSSRPELRRLGWILLAGVVGVLVIGGGVAYYFTQVPGNAADDYAEQARPAFEEVDDSVYDVFETFRARFFRGLAVKDLQEKRIDDNLKSLRRAFRRQYESDAATIKRAEESIATAEKAIADAESDLTEVDSPPLLGGVGDLGDADQTADQAAAYLDSAREFIPQYQALLAYSKETLALEEEITNAVLDEAPGAGASLDTYRQSLNSTLTRLKRARQKFNALDEPPPDGAAFRYATEAGLDLTLAYYEKLNTAFDQLDVGLFDEANKEIDQDLRRFGIKLFTHFDELQTSGEISDSIEQVEENEDDLADELDADAGPASVVPPFIPPDDKGNKQQA